MQKLPLYFQFNQLVFGNGFAARVEIVGRATAMEEFGAIWIYGVNPGGIAESGDDLASAYGSFRVWFAKVLFDFAAMAEGFGDFQRTVDQFVHDTDDDSVAEWQAAREAIRAGERPTLHLMVGVEPRDLEVRFEAEDLTEVVESPSPRLNCPPDSPVATLAA